MNEQSAAQGALETVKLTTEHQETTPEVEHRRMVFSLPVTLTVSLGQMRLSVVEVLQLQPDSILPLDARIDDPLELIVDGKVLARGELTEIEDGTLAIKITEIEERPDAS